MNERPHIKICGVTDPVDAAMAVAAGATHIGVIRVPGSARTRPLQVAREICGMATGARTAGVYVDEDPAAVLAEAERLGLDILQLHGREGPEVVEVLRARGFEVWKTVKPSTAEALLEAASRYAAADLLLVEGYSARGDGGVGARFDWDAVAAALPRLPSGTRLGVGGGLDPGNVGEAVRRFDPALVDVSSGVESGLGRKDPELVAAFIHAARET